MGRVDRIDTWNGRVRRSLNNCDVAGTTGRSAITDFCGVAGPNQAWLNRAGLTANEVRAMRNESNIFRNEALESHSRGSEARRDNLLRISPGWTTWAYWLLIGLFAAAFLYMAIARVDD